MMVRVFKQCSIVKLRYVHFFRQCCLSCLVAKLCLTLCNPMDYIQHARLLCPPLALSLLKFMSIELVILSNHLIPSCPFTFCLQSFPALGSFSVSWFYTSSGQSIGHNATAYLVMTV